jgi:hypothetical protein
MSNLLKPDLIHAFPISMLDCLQKWIFNFMKTHEQLNKYYEIWLSVPAYHNLTPKTKSNENVSQQKGKEMNEICQDIVGVVTRTVRGGSTIQCCTFNHPFEGRWAMFEFYMYGPCKSLDLMALSYIEDAWCWFHILSEAPIVGSAGKMVKAKANAPTTKLIMKFLVM